MNGNRGVKCLAVICGVVIGVVIVNIVTYVLSEWILCINTSGQDFKPLEDVATYIPRNIHQIFLVVNDDKLPPKYKEAQQTWIANNPGYRYTLWTDSMLAALISKKYPEIEKLYHSYGNWIQRLNVGKYVVLHEFGGIYADLDVWCKDKNAMGKLLSEIGNKSMVLSWSTGRGMATDLMVASQYHPFTAHLLRGLEAANRWFVIPYLNTMASTGTLYTLGRYYNYKHKELIHVFPMHRRADFIGNLHWSSWHRWDGVIIWWSYNHPFGICALILAALSILLILYKVVCRMVQQKCKRSECTSI